MNGNKYSDIFNARWNSVT